MVYTERDYLLIKEPKRGHGHDSGLKRWCGSEALLASLFLGSIVAIICFAPYIRNPTGNQNDATSIDEEFFFQAEEATTGRTPFSGRERTPTIRTSLGRLAGIRLKSRGGREYFGFYNVPYAEPPLGELRFMVCFPKISALIYT